MSESGFELSVVVPVYNGSASVAELVAALASLELAGGLEIVLVNDGSPDRSLEVCREACAACTAAVTVIDLARNFGEHNAVIAGLRVARGAHVITMDDDLQNPPEEVVKLLRHAQQSGLDVVYTRYAQKEHALWRNLGSKLTNWCADRLLDKPRGLYLSSFRCMNAFTAGVVAEYAGPFPYVDGLILQATQRVGSIEVLHLPRAIGRSNYTTRRLVRLFFSMALNHSVMPLRVATIVGMLIAGLGLVAVFVVVLEEMLMTAPPRGWGSLMGAVLVLAGVQLAMLGLIGEYLGRLFLTVNRKPQSVVRDVFRNERAGPR